MAKQLRVGPTEVDGASWLRHEPVISEVPLQCLVMGAQSAGSADPRKSDHVTVVGATMPGRVELPTQKREAPQKKGLLVEIERPP